MDYNVGWSKKEGLLLLAGQKVLGMLSSFLVFGGFTEWKRPNSTSSGDVPIQKNIGNMKPSRC